MPHPSGPYPRAGCLLHPSVVSPLDIFEGNRFKPSPESHYFAGEGIPLLLSEAKEGGLGENNQTLGAPNSDCLASRKQDT
jgi:hypothetical protein